MPAAHWPWRVPPGRGSSFSSWPRPWAGCGACAASCAEAGELLDGGIEAARLLGNTQALVWSLWSRSAVALAVGDMELALATAQESVDLSQDLDDGFQSAWAAVRLAAALSRPGNRNVASSCWLGSAGGEELALIPGGWRAYCLELLDA